MFLQYNSEKYLINTNMFKQKEHSEKKCILSNGIDDRYRDLRITGIICYAKYHGKK